MKPVKRRIKKHFGLTSKQVAIKSKRPFYVQWLLWAALVVLGYVVAYIQYHYMYDLHIEDVVMENQSLQTQLIKLERKIQMDHASHENLQRQIETMQNTNQETKEELLFYKNMMENKKKRR